jgi:two-component system, chemotaxis family, protein-glutamate methylesterase/glutaminase
MITSQASSENVEMETSNEVRVLIVDDSKTAREAIAAILKKDPAIQIVGQAVDGVEAVVLAAELKPDVITMDINMPKLNGYEATKQIMAQNPTPIVVLSSVTQEEMVHEGLNILLAGALEIVQKPGNLTTQNMDSIRAELIAKVKTVSQIKYK